MSSLTVFDVVAAKLGRPVTLEERRYLRRLSAQGVAKLNNDLLNGIEIASTLSDFKAVYDKMQERRAAVLATISTEARAVLEQMGRPATTDELTLFTSVPLAQILADVKKRTKEGETLASIIDELANEFKYQRLSEDAAAFGETQSMPTRVNVLTPILRPSTPNGLAPNMATIRKRKISVGLSPIVLWFKADEAEPTDPSNTDVNFDDSEDGLTIMSSPSLESTTKRFGSSDSLTLPVAAYPSTVSSASSELSRTSSSPKKVSIMEKPTVSRNNSTEKLSFKPSTQAPSVFAGKSLPKLSTSPTPSSASPSPGSPSPLSAMDSPVVERKIRRSFLPSLFKILD